MMHYKLAYIIMTSSRHVVHVLGTVLRARRESLAWSSSSAAQGFAIAIGMCSRTIDSTMSCMHMHNTSMYTVSATMSCHLM